MEGDIEVMMKPIGCIESVFKFKNGTPRQGGVCQNARAKLTISKSVFNNPEHSLEGLESFSHVWIVFWFHMNNNAYSKAKVKPPLLNGRKVGLFSSRSPYRPNPIGLTMAKLEAIEGSTLLLSGVDMLDGTPVLDIKPFIPQYDTPGFSSELAFDGHRCKSVETKSTNFVLEETPTDELKSEDIFSKDSPCFPDGTQYSDTISDAEGYKRNENPDDVDKCNSVVNNDMPGIMQTVSRSKIFQDETTTHSDEDFKIESENFTKTVPVECSDGVDILGKEEKSLQSQAANCEMICERVNETVDHVSKGLIDVDDQNVSFSACHSASYDEVSNGKEASDITNKHLPFPHIANWISKPPISKLSVRFTVTAEQQLSCFNSQNTNVKYQLCLLKSAEEAQEAICSILQADPRSTYRRKHCEDRLYYFTLDVLHITCWFDGACAEVLRIKPIADVAKLRTP